LLGWAMSDLHAAWADYGDDLPDALAECGAQLDQMRRYFSDDNIKEALRRKLGLSLDFAVFQTLKDGLARAKKLSPHIPLHLDLVRGNILFDSTRDHNSPWQIDDVTLTGLIDFEKIARAPAILDIARTYAFLMVDCAGKTPAKIYKYLIKSGYNKRGQSQIALPSPELTPIFWRLVRFFLTYDFYKFLRYNPYEFLAENHHFCLTCDILIQKNVLEYWKESEGRNVRLEKTINQSK
jgi:hypothetical protein